MPRHKRRINPDTLVFLKQVRGGLFVFSIVALIVISIWYGSRIEALTIIDVQVVGGETISRQEIMNVVQDGLEGTYLGLVPKRFSLLYPQQSLIEQVTALDRVHDVVIKRIDGHTLQVSFSEFIPRALWCESVDSDMCLFLDNDGYAFGVAPRLSGGSLVRFVTLGQAIQTGARVTDFDTFGSLFELIDLLTERDWYVSHIELDLVGDVFVVLSAGGELKVSGKESPEKMVNNLMTVIASPDFSHLKPGNFQYIDLRFGNKVFVNEEEVLAPEESGVLATTTEERLQVADE